MLTRVHVRAMMGPQGLGYRAALRVLREQKARPDFYVYLEELRKEQLAAERLAVTASDEEDGPGRASERKSSTLFNSRIVVG